MEKDATCDREESRKEKEIDRLHGARAAEEPTKISQDRRGVNDQSVEEGELNAKIMRVSVDLIIYTVHHGTVMAATYRL